ncbi:MAG: hypothetical protein ACP5LM_04145 [Thermoplasmata archaeon]
MPLDPCIITDVYNLVEQMISEVESEINQIMILIAKYKRYQNWQSIVDRDVVNPINSYLDQLNLLGAPYQHVYNQITSLGANLQSAQTILNTLTQFTDPSSPWCILDKNSPTRISGTKISETKIDPNFILISLLFNLFEGLDIAIIVDNANIALSLANSELQKLNNLADQISNLANLLVANKNLANNLANSQNQLVNNLNNALNNISQLANIQPNLANSVGLADCDSLNNTKTTYDQTYINNLTNLNDQLANTLNTLLANLNSPDGSNLAILSNYLANLISSFNNIKQIHKDLILTIQTIGKYTPYIINPYGALYALGSDDVINSMLSLAKYYLQSEYNMLANLKDSLTGNSNISSDDDLANLTAPNSENLAFTVGSILSTIQAAQYINLSVNKMLGLNIPDNYKNERAFLQPKLCSLYKLANEDYLTPIINLLKQLPNTVYADNLDYVISQIGNINLAITNLANWLEDVISVLSLIVNNPDLAKLYNTLKNEINLVKQLLRASGLKTEKFNQIPVYQIMSGTSTASLTTEYLNCISRAIGLWTGSTGGKIALVNLYNTAVSQLKELQTSWQTLIVPLKNEISVLLNQKENLTNLYKTINQQLKLLFEYLTGTQYTPDRTVIIKQWNNAATNINNNQAANMISPINNKRWGGC